MARISFEEGLELYKHADLATLQKEANRIRFEKNPARQVTFILDSNPNYTNVCNADCSFCAFYRHDGVKDAYTKSIDEVMQHMELARRAGLNTVLLQGGLNDTLKIDYYVALVKTARERYPDIYPHFFSAPEIWNVARVSHMSIREVLQELWNAGLRSIPGGGAEILSERVRLQISPKKMESGAWMAVHETAHQLGYRTTATMMYGHVEEPEDIILHLDTLRKAQDNIPGFTAFIPWSYKRTNTALRRTVKGWAGREAFLRILAVSRIYLDNFDHVQSTYFSEGKDVGVESLSYGADDFGGIIMEENVHRATRHVNRTDLAGIIGLIRQAGFTAARRSTLYDILEVYDASTEVIVPEAQAVREEDSLVLA